MDLGSNVASLRRLRGWSQEELAERCGLSVRTIRNVELGSVTPRHSSLRLLLRALDATVDGGDTPPPERWRGLPPPRQPAVGIDAEVHELTRVVLGSRLTALHGPGGIGKTRIALAVAAKALPALRRGVAVVELGDLPPDGTAAGIVERARRLAGDDPQWAETAAAGGPDLLIVLDNAEHVPSAVATAGKELLNEYPRAHLLVTSRRPVAERLGACHEIRPLRVDPAPGDGAAYPPAVELLLRHASAWLSAADLATELPQVVELCRRLGGVPRALEFAAERLRTIPIRALLTAGPALGMLRTSDHSLLPHQRSVAASIRWSVELMSEEHRRLLRRLGRLPGAEFTLEQVVEAARGGTEAGGEDVLCLFSDLVDHGVVAATRERSYRYRLMPYVWEVVRAYADPPAWPTRFAAAA